MLSDKEIRAIQTYYTSVFGTDDTIHYIQDKDMWVCISRDGDASSVLSSHDAIIAAFRAGMKAAAHFSAE